MLKHDTAFPRDAEFLEYIRSFVDESRLSRAAADRLFALARRGAEGWIYLKKGERRPVGQVLVAYHDKREWEFEKALTGDDAPSMPKLAIACWIKSHDMWMTRNLMVDGVYAWMPLPPPPSGETND